MTLISLLRTCVATALSLVVLIVSPARAEATDEIDRYMQAAISVARVPEDQGGVTQLRELGAEGFAAATDLLAVIDLAKTKQATPTAAQNNAIATIRGIWREATMVPLAWAGNTLDFVALQLLPRTLDVAVVQWLAENGQDYPPVYAFEAERRLLAVDTNEATYWLALGMLRLRFEAARCKSDPVLGDLRVMWGGYASGQIQKLGSDRDVTAAYPQALQRALSRWDDAVPIPTKSWIPCAADVKAGISANEQRQNWIGVREELRLAVIASLARGSDAGANP